MTRNKHLSLLYFRVVLSKKSNSCQYPLINYLSQTAKKLTTSAGCSPIVFESQQKSNSPKRSSRRRNQVVRNSTSQFICSDSEESHDVQEERRADFEKFRNQKKLKRKVPQFEAPQFAIGQPLSNDNLKISALFPRLEDTNCQPGRVNICLIPIWDTLKNHQKIWRGEGGHFF